MTLASSAPKKSWRLSMTSNAKLHWQQVGRFVSLLAQGQEKLAL
jgi:hypothetical protein